VSEASLIKLTLTQSCFYCFKKRKERKVNLQSVGKKFVHLGKLGGDTEVDCPVADLDDEATDDIGVDLGGMISIGYSG